LFNRRGLEVRQKRSATVSTIFKAEPALTSVIQIVFGTDGERTAEPSKQTRRRADGKPPCYRNRETLDLLPPVLSLSTGAGATWLGTPSFFIFRFGQGLMSW